jgi:hypothetical protein
MNWTKLGAYAVAAAAVCLVVFASVRHGDTGMLAVLPGVFVAVYLADRDGGCSRRRRNDG